MTTSKTPAADHAAPAPESTKTPTTRRRPLSTQGDASVTSGTPYAQSRSSSRSSVRSHTRPMSSSTLNKPAARTPVGNSGRTRNASDDTASVTSGDGDAKRKSALLNGSSRRMSSMEIAGVKPRPAKVAGSPAREKLNNASPAKEKQNTASPAKEKQDTASTPTPAPPRRPPVVSRISRGSNASADTVGSTASSNPSTQAGKTPATPIKLAIRSGTNAKERIAEESEDGNSVETASRTTSKPSLSVTSSPPRVKGSPRKLLPAAELVSRPLPRPASRNALGAQEPATDPVKGHQRAQSAVTPRSAGASDDKAENEKNDLTREVAQLERKRAAAIEEKVKESERLRSEHQADLEKIKSTSAANLEQVKADHAKEVAALKDEAHGRLGHATAVENAQRVQIAKITALEESLQAERDALASAKQALDAQTKEHSKSQENHKRKASSSARDAKNSLQELKDDHAKQLEALGKELESYRHKSSTFDGVETKIANVEAALQATKSEASQNEEHLQQEIKSKDEDKEHLVKVIEDLKEEIDRVEKHLDEQNAQERDAKKKAEQITAQLRKELTEMRKEKEDAAFESSKLLKKLRQEVANVQKSKGEEVDRLRKESDTIRETSETFQSELANLRKERDDDHDQHVQQLEETKRALEDLREASRKENEQYQQEVSSLMEKNGESDKLADKMKEELRSLRTMNESELKQRQDASDSATSLIEGLRKQIVELERDGTAGSDTLAKLEDELKSLRQTKEDQAKEHQSTTDELQAMIEQLQANSSEFDKTIEQTKQERDDAAKASEAKLQAMQDERQALQERLDEVNKTTSSRSSELDDTINKLKEEIETLTKKETEASQAREAALAEKDEFIKDLEEQHEAFQQHHDNVNTQSKSEIKRLNKVTSDLHNEIESEAKRLNAIISDLTNEVESLRETQSTSSNKDSRTEAETKKLQDTITDLKNEIDALKEAQASSATDKASEMEELRRKADDSETLAQRLQSRESEALQAKDEEMQKLRSTVQEEVQKFKAEYEEEVAALKASMLQTGQEAQQALQNAVAEHSIAVQARDSGHGAAIQEISRKYEEELAVLREVEDTPAHAGIIETLKLEHAEELVNVSEEAKDRLEALAKEHAQGLVSQAAIAAKAQEDALLAVKAQHQGQLEALETLHTEEVTALRESAVQSIEQDQQPVTTDRSASAGGAEAESLATRCAELKAEMELAKQAAARDQEALRSLEAKLALSYNRSSPKRFAFEKPGDNPLADGGRSGRKRSESVIWDGSSTVEGTLASIQEQVRQLEELNDQIGQESGKWRSPVGTRIVA